MRVLVVGTVPPPGGQSAKELAAVVADRVEAGDSVEVLSPDPRSAAHHTANLETLMLPLRLALMSTRFDALVLRIEPRLPLGEQTNRLVRGATLFALGVVFGMYSEVVIRLDSPIPLPGGVGGRATADMWRRASTIVVANDSDRQRILSAPGVEADRVKIAMPLEAADSDRDHAWPQATEVDLREQVLAKIRLRADAERRSNDARVELGATGVGPLTSEAFSASARVSPSSSSLARAVVHRAMREVLARLPKTG